MAHNEESPQGRGRLFGRRSFIKGAVAGTGLAAADVALLSKLGSAATNRISTENAKPGTDAWDIMPDDEIEGFTTQWSVNAGETVKFKVKSASTNYQFVIYRLGWYGGLGGREVARFSPSVSLPQSQPAPIKDVDLGLIDAGNWAVSGQWAVPADAVSGVYLAILNRLDKANSANRVMFVVRNDGVASDILLQTSDSTYAAYNVWGGNSLYFGTAFYGRATKVSYNRPQIDSETENNFFYSEYPLVRWLERNGYDVNYCGNVDTETRGAEIKKRKVFISSGHDEYWSAGMRTNVEAARDAGVHLVFMTANECFWKVRWENSVDASATPNRTVVCYKETLENAKTDPTPAWTGTWRDGRFTSFPNGANPENALTGTLFRAINPVGDFDFNIEVPFAYSKLRIWRNTSVANLTAGQKASLAEGTLGYEWNTDQDNGRRPAGLIRMSQTTDTAQQVLQDEGSTYVVAPLTHYITLYRAASKALVWSTGTCQWAWGLDENHWTRPEQAIPADVRMQQATMNVLADMGVQPSTRQASLVAASASTDTLAPTATVTSPANGANVVVGTVNTIAGTATDTGGGVVAAVEVSTDNGATWHPATGTASWSYSFTPLALGAVSVKVRAIDDSCNIQATPTSLSLNSVGRPYPVTLFAAGATPANPALSDTSAVELGVKFRSSIAGFVTGVRFYKGAGNTGTHVGNLWSGDGQKLATATFSSETASGWQSAAFAKPVAISPGTTYIASYFAPNGHYAGDTKFFASAYDLYPLRALTDGEDGPNGVYRVGQGFPDSTFNQANYWVDVTFDIDDHVNPTVSDVYPGANLEAVATNAAPRVVFSEAMEPATIVMELRDPANALVAGSVAYDAATRGATFTPSAALANLKAYALKVTAQDKAGNAMAAPFTSAFTTVSPVGGAPTPLWDTSVKPVAASVNDSSAVELGVKFTADIDGEIKAIRFYKGVGNSGAHVAHLWNAGGTLLGTATFAAESATGWQQANFATPVKINKNMVYVASYFAPAGHYAGDGGFFGAAVNRGPLHGLVSGGAGGANGVYLYGSSGGFPSNSYNDANYWVDVLYSIPADTNAPTVTGVAPASGLIAVAPAGPLVATFSEPMTPGSITFTVSGPGGNAAGTVAYDAAKLAATFTPTSPMAAGGTFTASVKGNDSAGNPMAATHTWSFTVATAAGQAPATLWDTSAVPAILNDTDTASVELGVKFTVDRPGRIAGLRFYKGPGSPSTNHTGRLWLNDGTQLKSVVFTNQTASGWQQVLFDTPVAVQAGTVYVASYLAPAGKYSATVGGLSSSVTRAPLATQAGGGCYLYGSGGFPTSSSSANYWVDVIFYNPA